MKYTFLFVFLIASSAKILSQTTDPQGRKQGYWKKKDEKTNKLVYEGMFKDDKPVGTFKYYHSNDSIKAIIQFKTDGKTSYARLFNMNGKRMGEGKYIGKELKDSVWTYYDDGGTLISRENYLKGMKSGKSFVYFPDGVISQERNFKNGLEDGTYIEFFEKNLKRAKGQYSNGEKEGKFTYYYPNGVEVAAGYYKKGLKNGPWIYRSEDGKVKEKELYQNGEQASKKETEAFFNKNKVQNQTPKPETKKADPKAQGPGTKTGSK